MSADNFYEIRAVRENEQFRFAVSMGFASDEQEEPLVPDHRSAWFDTLDKAIQFVDRQYAEYGWTVITDDEAYRAYEEEQSALAQEKASAITRIILGKDEPLVLHGTGDPRAVPGIYVDDSEFAWQFIERPGHPGQTSWLTTGVNGIGDQHTDSDLFLVHRTPTNED